MLTFLEAAGACIYHAQGRNETIRQYCVDFLFFLHDPNINGEIRVSTIVVFLFNQKRKKKLCQNYILTPIRAILSA